jgi:hypothetical protein
MSYFSEIEQQTPEHKSRKKSYSGMSGKNHSQQSKDSISATQKARYELLRKAVEKATDDNRIRQVVREELLKLVNESQPVNNKPNNIQI